MVPFPRILRLLALAVVIAVAYFAQYIFDHGTLQTLYPAWATAHLPLLQRSTLWLAGDLYTLAIWLMCGCALLFGLLVPGWEEQPLPEQGAATDEAPNGNIDTAQPGSAQRMAGLALPVAAALFLAGWGWTSLPVGIDATGAQAGLQGQALLAGQGSWFAAGANGASQVVYLPVALAAALLGSLLDGSHLIGLLAALATAAATYLVASELFRSAPQRRALAGMAAGFTACAVALLHFGRMAPLLPATALGSLAAWALLAGQRRAGQPRVGLTLVATSGALAALAAWPDRSGLIFVPLLLLWWLGLALVQRATWRAAGVWLGATFLFAAPLIIVWLLNPPLFQAYLQGGAGRNVPLSDWWMNLRASLATLIWLPDAGALADYQGHYIHSVVAPLFILAGGALLLNLDRLLGWCLLTWLGVTLLFSSAVNTVAPDWALLLPLLPVVGMAIVFALDRSAALWNEASQEAGSGAAASLAGGLLLAVAALTWVSYYQFAAANGDPASYTGRALATLSPGAVAVLVASAPNYIVPLDDPVIQFAAGARANQALAVGIDGLPATLPPDSQVIVQGADSTALSAARARYPGAQVTVTRDVHANPRLFVLRLP